MNILDAMFQSFVSTGGTSIDALVLSLLVAFLIGQMNAWCYKWTHRGVSYSRTFTQSLILIAMIVSLAMYMVLQNVIAAFGLLGGLAIIRYRTVVRDSRDTAYILLCLVCGMAAGFGQYQAAIVGSLAANGVAIYLHQTGFGAWRALDSLLRFHVRGRALESPTIDTILHKYCRRVSLLSVDESDVPEQDYVRTYECSYKLRLRKPEWGANIVSELKSAVGAETIHLLVQQEHEEVI